MIRVLHKFVYFERIDGFLAWATPKPARRGAVFHLSLVCLVSILIWLAACLALGVSSLLVKQETSVSQEETKHLSQGLSKLREIQPKRYHFLAGSVVKLVTSLLLNGFQA